MTRTIIVIIGIVGTLASVTGAWAQMPPSPAPYGWDYRVQYAPAPPITSGRIGPGAGSTNWYDRTSELSGG